MCGEVLIKERPIRYKPFCLEGVVIKITSCQIRSIAELTDHVCTFREFLTVKSSAYP